MVNLSKAPLIYTLGMIRFPRVPHMKRFALQFFDAIRSDYPLETSASVPVFHASVTSEGLKVESSATTEIWQYASPSTDWAFIVTDQTFCLHTIKYIDFDDFFGRFQKGFEHFMKIPELNIEFLSAVGLRYVDLLAPEAGEPLRAYLAPWVLSADALQPGLPLLNESHVAHYKTEVGELRFQALKNPPFSLPPELQSALINHNDWLRPRPETEFAIIDTDYSIDFPSPVPLKTEQMLKNLRQLNQGTKTIFKSFVTEQALLKWGQP